MAHGIRSGIALSQSRMPRGGATAAVVISAVFLLAPSCGQPTPMERLANDPIAELQLGTAERVQVVEREAGEVMGKPQPAVRQLIFRPLEGASLAEVLEEAVSAAEALGWNLARRPSGKAYRGQRLEGDQRIALEIYLDPTTGNVAVQLSGS